MTQLKERRIGRSLPIHDEKFFEILESSEIIRQCQPIVGILEYGLKLFSKDHPFLDP